MEYRAIKQRRHYIGNCIYWQLPTNTSSKGKIRQLHLEKVPLINCFIHSGVLMSRKVIGLNQLLKVSDDVKLINFIIKTYHLK